MPEKVPFFWSRRAKFSPVCDASFPRALALFFAFFGGQKFRKFSHFFALFWDLKNWHFLVSGPIFGFLAKPAKTSILADFRVSGQIRRVAPKVPKSATFQDFGKNVRFLRFCRFLWISEIFRKSPKIWRFGLFPDMSGNVQKLRFWTPQTAQLWGPKNLNFRHISGHQFRGLTMCHLSGCVGCYMCYFSEFFVSKKIGKIYQFGLNHLVTAG